MEKKEKIKKVRVLLVGAEDEENLSIRYLAAVLEKDGHKVKIAPCSRYEHFPQVLEIVSKYKPHLIGISIAFQSLAKMFFKLVEEIRKLNYNGHIIVGGHFPTFEYRKILETQPGIDSVCRFEGEQTIVELANHLAGNFPLSSVTNLVYRASDGIHENKCIYKFPVLDELPFPKRNKKAQIRLGEKFATLIASRGCWHSSCLYCCIGAFHSKKEGRKFAIRSPENVAEEIGELYHKYGVRLFQFHDDNFMLPSKEETIERLKALKRAIEAKKVNTENIAFLIKARPDTVDENVALALKELGVVGVFLGIENASESGLKALIRRVTLEDIHRAISALTKFDIIVTYNLLIFHPMATLDEINENIEFIRKYIHLPFDFGRAEVVAGSPLEKMLINNKRLLGSWPNWNYEIFDEVVERMFKINYLTFRRKDSLYSRLVESTIALAYHAYTIKRLHKGPIADEIVKKVNKLIPEINAFILKEIGKMYGLALGHIEKSDIEKLYEDISNGCKKYLRLIDKITRKMLRLQVIEHIFDSFGVKDVVQKYRLFKFLFRLG